MLELMTPTDWFLLFITVVSLLVIVVWFIGCVKHYQYIKAVALKETELEPQDEPDLTNVVPFKPVTRK